MNKTGPVKVAMIGLGWWGKKMTAVLQKAKDDIEIICAAEPNPAAKEFAEANHRNFDGAGLIHLDLNLRCLPVANRDGVTADESANLCWAPSAVDASATTASHTAPSTAFCNVRTAASNFFLLRPFRITSAPSRASASGYGVANP